MEVPDVSSNIKMSAPMAIFLTGFGMFHDFLATFQVFEEKTVAAHHPLSACEDLHVSILRSGRSGHQGGILISETRELY